MGLRRLHQPVGVHGHCVFVIASFESDDRRTCAEQLSSPVLFFQLHWRLRCAILARFLNQPSSRTPQQLRGKGKNSLVAKVRILDLTSF